jgi:putative flippase GtrA
VLFARRPKLRTSNLSSRSFLVFLCVGGTCTLVHYALMALFAWTGVPVVAASAAGFALSAVLNYVLNETLTFHSTVPRHVAAPRFVAVALCGLALNQLLLTVWLRAGLSPIPAQLLATTGVIVWNYCIHGAWTFSSRRD